MPGFVPHGIGECELKVAPGSDSNSIQVHYKYSLDGRNAEHARLEGSPTFLFPFPVNKNIKNNTPYFERYKKRSELAIKSRYPASKIPDQSNNKYEGLDRCESPLLLGGWWVPKDTSEYKTKLGNPPMFVCSSSFCILTLDQGNGWIVEAIFNESALEDWRTFFVQFNESIDKIMQPTH